VKDIDIIIPTRNRFYPLIRLLHSIPNQSNIKVRVCFDNDSNGKKHLEHIIKEGKELNNKLANMELYLTDHNMGSVYCRNMMARDVNDGLLFLCDDMELPNDKFNINSLIEEFNVCFPNDDGVLGIQQTLPDFHPTGVALIGQKFLQRYHNKQFLNPQYWLFACQELHWYANAVDAFKMSNQSVNHYHPAFKLAEIDDTHKLGRIHKERDTIIREERMRNGLIWGLNS
jgi:hypothetical protein